MISIARRLEFRPRLLIDASEEVTRKHPIVAGASRRPSPEDLDDLRQRVEDCGGDSSRLQALAESLKLSEARSMAYALVHWSDLIGELEVVLFHRTWSFLPKVLWRTVEGVPSHQVSWLFLKRAIKSTPGLGSWMPETWKLSFLEWLEADNCFDGISQWADARGYTIASLPQLSDSPIRRDSKLFAHLGQQRLCRASGLAILAESEELRREWLGQMSPEELEAASKNYLTTVPSTSWEEWQLEEVEESFGIPGAKGSRSVFWNRLSAKIQEEFRRRRIDVKLQRFFHDHDRLRYWRSRWSSRMVDFSTGWAGTVRYAILHFGKFGVVEFAETGNAAYFYDAKDLAEVSKVEVTSPASLKRRIDYDIDPWWAEENRLIHRRGWYSDADTRMERWLREKR